MKVSLTLKTSLLSLTLFSSAAFAGVGSGNTGLFRPKNKEGKEIRIEFKAEHPMQKELLKNLSEVEMPNALTQEMSSDFENTTIVFSNEMITLGDLNRQLLTRCIESKRTTETTTHPNGTQTKKLTQEETCTEVEANNNVGITISPVNYNANGLDETYVAAYTIKEPKTVVYFTTFLNQMNSGEKKKLVLHEQAHRLSYLAQFNDDERQVEAWTNAVFRYFSKNTSKKDFFAILNKLKLPTNVPNYVSGEIYMGGSNFKLKSSITFMPTTDLFFGESEEGFGIQFKDPSLFTHMLPDQILGSYPMLIMPYHYKDTKKKVWEFWKEKIKQQEPITLPVEISYNRTGIKDSNGLTSPQYTVHGISVNRSDELLQIWNQLQSIFAEHPVTVLKENFVSSNNRTDMRAEGLFWSKTDRVAFMNLFNGINDFLNEMKVNNPVEYALLKKTPLHFSFSDGNCRPLLACWHGRLLINLNYLENYSIAPLEQITQQIKWYLLNQAMQNLDDFRKLILPSSPPAYQMRFTLDNMISHVLDKPTEWKNLRDFSSAFYQAAKDDQELQNQLRCINHGTTEVFFKVDETRSSIAFYHDYVHSTTKRYTNYIVSMPEIPKPKDVPVLIELIKKMLSSDVSVTQFYKKLIVENKKRKTGVFQKGAALIDENGVLKILHPIKATLDYDNRHWTCE